MIYSKSDIEQADDLSLSYVIAKMGFKVKRVGSCYTTDEMDSLRVYNDRTWCRHSRKVNREKIGGGVLDFLTEYGDMTFPQAVEWALAEKMVIPEGVSEFPEWKPKTDKKLFVLPERNVNNKRLFAYLIQKRKLSYRTIEYFIRQGIMYESREHHNIVFLGKDKDGIVQFASMRGTNDVQNVKPFKCDVEGNDKRYGINLYREDSQTVAVFEGGIDMLSFEELENDKCSLLTLGMVDDAPLKTFLEEHRNIHVIKLALDHDEAGKEATERIKHYYEKLGYSIQIYEYPERYKDVNNYLKSKMERVSSRDRVNVAYKR